MTCRLSCLPMSLVRRLAKVSREKGIPPDALVTEAVRVMLTVLDGKDEPAEAVEVVWHGGMKAAPSRVFETKRARNEPNGETTETA
jgi:hypothetical protein